MISKLKNGIALGNISSVIETDNKPNYASINAHQATILEVTKLKHAGKKINYYNNFVIIDDKTYNVRPEVVRML